MSTFSGRDKTHHERLERRKDLIKKVQAMKDAGYSNGEIAQQLKINESTILVLLQP